MKFMLNYLALILSGVAISSRVYQHAKIKWIKREYKIHFLRDVERYKRRVETCRKMGFEPEAQKWEEIANSFEQYLTKTKP